MPYRQTPIKAMTTTGKYSGESQSTDGSVRRKRVPSSSGAHTNVRNCGPGREGERGRARVIHLALRLLRQRTNKQRMRTQQATDLKCGHAGMQKKEESIGERLNHPSVFGESIRLIARPFRLDARHGLQPRWPQYPSPPSRDQLGVQNER